MITQAILVIAMAGYYKGGPDHIEFKNIAQCERFKAALDKECTMHSNRNIAFKSFNVESICIPIEDIK